MQKNAIVIAVILLMTIILPIATAQGKPDLSISRDDITFSDDTPETGQEIYINATVHNDLNTALEDAKNVEVLFNDTYHIGTQQITETIGETIIPLIKKGESNTTSIKWKPQTAGRHDIEVIVDPDNKIDETNENNNQATNYVIVSPSTALDVTIELSKGKSGRQGRYYPNEEMWVNGTVKTSVGTTISNADVVITIVETNSTWNTTTDGSGNYRQNMTSPEKPKKYNLKVNATRGTQNGENSTTFRILSSPNANLVIFSFSVSPSSPKVGDRISIDVGIRNDGTGDAESIDVVFYVDDKQIENKTVDIPKDESKTVHADWIAEKGKKQIIVNVWYNGEIIEGGNQSKTITVEEKEELQNSDLTPIFIAGFIGLIAVVVFLIFRKRKSKS